MNTKKFNGKNLKNARLYRRMTLTELASKINVTKQAMSLYENGKNTPDYEKILKISHILDFPHEFFFQSFTFDSMPEVTYFRSLSSASRSSRISNALRLDYISKIYNGFSKYIDFPKLNILTYDLSDNINLEELENFGI